jgi:hypothetical protein
MLNSLVVRHMFAELTKIAANRITDGLRTPGNSNRILPNGPPNPKPASGKNFGKFQLAGPGKPTMTGTGRTATNLASNTPVGTTGFTSLPTPTSSE